MITGRVLASREAAITLRVVGPDGQSRRIQAVIDTGFDGWLCLPPRVISHLRLPWQDSGRAALADGSITTFGIYGATVIWDKRPRRVSCAALQRAPSPLQ